MTLSERTILALAAHGDSDWDRVKSILDSSSNIVVLDGTKPAPLRANDSDQPAYGDWMVQHLLSDPESYNPYTSSDAGATRVFPVVTLVALLSTLATVVWCLVLYGNSMLDTAGSLDSLTLSADRRTVSFSL